MDFDTSYEAYFDTLTHIFGTIRNTQRGNLKKAAEMVAATVMGGGIVHAFGAGHSHILVEELFCRAGGLGCVNGILEPSFMPHSGADKSSRLEQVAEIARLVFEDEDIRKGDLMILISQSGINPVVVEFARLTRERGVPIVAVTSVAHSQATPSRHSSGQKLYELADVVLDNGCPVGDAAMEVGEKGIRVAAMSTIMGGVLLQGLVYLAVQDMVRQGFDPPVRVSRNLVGGERNNLQFRYQYAGRIKRL